MVGINRSSCGGEAKPLTYARVVVHHAEDPVAPSLHVVVRTDAAEHGRQPELGPRFVAQLPATDTV